jgi:riboflavin synthase
MFTGLIESVGLVTDVASAAPGVRLRLATPLASELRAGDSLAVNGVCLTVASVADGGAQFDVGPETARVTTLGGLSTGHQVNLERAVRADSRFGGHFVQGHVDATGTVKAIRDEGDAHWLTVTFEEALAAYLIPKGSIAIDGVSLTIATLRDAEFDVMIIPFTWEHTNLHARATRDRVNLECDMVGKYVARAAQAYVGAGLSRLDKK